MNKIDLEKLIENIFIEDYSLNEKYTYISQMGVLTIKSLIPSIDDLGARIDYKRFKEEINLWKGYRTDENPSLLNIDKMDSDIYWSKNDDSIFSRIVPIILGNQKYEVLEEELIKNILFTTGNIGDMFEYLSIGYLIYLVIGKEENILEKLKEKIIGFGQVEFINKYERYYKEEIGLYKGNYKVDFEKEKIHIINLLNGVDSGRYSMLEDCIGVIDKRDGETFPGKVLYGYLYGRDREYELPNFYLSMGRYIINLRKSRINPKDLEIKEYILPDIFKFNEGDIFFHSLLRDSKVIKKEVRGNTPTSLVQTKTGMYLFKKIDL